MGKTVYLTREGLAKLEEELTHLRTVRRHEVAERIRRAKEFTNTVDNAEYDDAKNEQAFIESRIFTLEQQLRHAVLIENNVAADCVGLGSRVTVLDSEGFEETYTIVGSAEARPSEGKISNESPVGRALLGRRRGDMVSVQVPAGMLFLTVAAIE